MYPEAYESIQLRVIAERRGMDVFVGDFKNGADLNTRKDLLGDIVIWRTSRLLNEDLDTLKNFLTGKKVLNQAVIKERMLRSKDYQQRLVQAQTSVPIIPTFTFESFEGLEHALESGMLSYPFIVKPLRSGKAKGVRLISDKTEIDFVDYSKLLFQPFIQNNGDYRVLMLGGEMLGAYKRVGAKGSVLNNISKGGTPVAIHDEALLNQLENFGVQISKATGLDFFGLDVIEDSENGGLHFMEINVAPEWAGFEKIHQVAVADILLYWLTSGEKGNDGIEKSE
jgi:glutathione synthase/RimK-type ligase-like ATP-grasp enzyme